jgi:hypothetical protein
MANLIEFIENNSNFEEVDLLQIYKNIAIDVTNCPSNKIDAMHNSLYHLNIKLHFLTCQRDSHQSDSKHIIQCEDIIVYCMENKLICLISDSDATLIRLINTKALSDDSCSCKLIFNASLGNQIEFYSLIKY